MATLFQRLVGDLSAEESEEKIPIHPFISALYELERGNLTVNQVATLFSIDASDKPQANALMNYIKSSANKADMIRVIKDWLYLAEWGVGNSAVTSRYWSASNFATRLDEELFRQGV